MGLVSRGSQGSVGKRPPVLSREAYLKSKSSCVNHTKEEKRSLVY